MGWLDSVTKAVTTVATGGANLALQNKKVSNAVNKITAPVGKRVAAAATAMRLPSIATNINIKKALTNPVAYAKDNAAAYAKDATVAVSIYGNLKKGNVKGIVTQGLADTKAAASAAVTGKTPAVAWQLDPPVIPPPVQAAPTFSQLTGEPVPFEPQDPMASTTPSRMATAPTSPGASKTPIFVIAGALAAVVLLVVIVR